MTPYFFLLGPGRLKPLRTVERIAKKHDAAYVEITEPGRSVRHWFECQNLGAPFDGATAAAVRSDLVAAGILAPVEPEGGK